MFYDSSVVYSLVEGKQLSVYTLLLSRTGIPARHENFVVGYHFTAGDNGLHCSNTFRVGELKCTATPQTQLERVVNLSFLLLLVIP